jgi:hypothetical protein
VRHRLQFDRPYQQFPRSTVGNAVVIRVREQEVVGSAAVIVPGGGPSAERLERTVDPFHLVMPIDDGAGAAVQDVRPGLRLHAECKHAQVLAAGEPADREVVRPFAVLAAGGAVGEYERPDDLVVRAAGLHVQVAAVAGATGREQRRPAVAQQVAHDRHLSRVHRPHRLELT